MRLRNRAGHVALYAAAMTAGLWAAQAPVLSVAGPESHAAELAGARQGERTVDSVERLTASLAGTPARAGVRPAFIPRAAIVVKDGAVAVVGLDEALSARAGGSVVAWLP